MTGMKGVLDARDQDYEELIDDAYTKHLCTGRKQETRLEGGGGGGRISSEGANAALAKNCSAHGYLYLCC